LIYEEDLKVLESVFAFQFFPYFFILNPERISERTWSHSHTYVRRMYNF